MRIRRTQYVSQFTLKWNWADATFHILFITDELTCATARAELWWIVDKPGQDISTEPLNTIGIIMIIWPQPCYLLNK